MNIKEKVFLKRNLITILIVFAVFIFSWMGISKVMGNHFSDYLFTWDSHAKYNELELDQIRVEFDKDGIINLESLKKENGKIIYTLSPINKGKVIMSVYKIDSNEEIYKSLYQVLQSGTIIDISTENFTHYRVYHLALFLFCLALTVILWFSFVYIQKILRYSYQAIFFSGLAIWMTLISILLGIVWFQEKTMINVYEIFKTAALEFMLISFPLILIFCIALSVSNIKLIRKEGFRPQNGLGIIISFAMLVGALIVFILFDSFSSGSEMQLKMFNALTSITSSVYAFLECFLIGSILCGTLAAKHEPKYDKDYLVILGCKIGADGKLYPLIQARVDRAINFYQKQFDLTGKKAFFLPSGGQGPDEPVSEAAAMKRYLLEKGIPEEQILLEDKSKNTIENMLFSKKIIEKRTPNANVAFSTTNYHVFRSGIISRQNGFEPDGMGSKTKWYFWPNAYIREVIGVMAYKWKSIIIVLIPIVIFLIAIQFVG